MDNFVKRLLETNRNVLFIREKGSISPELIAQADVIIEYDVRQSMLAEAMTRVVWHVVKGGTSG